MAQRKRELGISTAVFGRGILTTAGSGSVALYIGRVPVYSGKQKNFGQICSRERVSDRAMTLGNWNKARHRDRHRVHLLGRRDSTVEKPRVPMCALWSFNATVY